MAESGHGTAAAIRRGAPGGMLPPGRPLSRVFAGRPEQVGHARAFVRGLLGDSPVTDAAVLLCSELAANAVLHSASALPGGQFNVRVEVCGRDYLGVEVEDQGGPWLAREPSQEGGRGLLIVAEMASLWEIRGDDRGRVIWARLDWPDE
jgi:serine/threonine-protein kinase RsbW